MVTVKTNDEVYLAFVKNSLWHTNSRDKTLVYDPSPRVISSDGVPLALNMNGTIYLRYNYINRKQWLRLIALQTAAHSYLGSKYKKVMLGPIQFNAFMEAYLKTKQVTNQYLDERAEGDF